MLKEALNNKERFPADVSMHAIFIEREARELMHLVASVCPSICPFVCALKAEPFDLRP